MTTKLFQNGLRWHRDKLPEAAAEKVEIRAGNEVIESIDAVPGTRDFAQYSVDEYTGTDSGFDWLVAADELLFPGGKREPEDGWEVRWKLADGRTMVYLARPAGGTRVFDNSDRLGLMYRIHTKLDRIEPA